MKKSCFTTLMCGALVLLLAHTSPMRAASNSSSQSTGSITGRVQNVATGQYLNNARVALKGTPHVAQTDSFGIYRLSNVPSGPAVLEVFYTDLDRQEIAVDIPPAGMIERDVGLTSAARYGNVVQLDAFKVAADRETDAQALATNEQRFAPNIKNVVSTESLGDVLGYNVGEFMKLLPGVTTSTSGVEVTQIGVRGFDGSKTAVTTDGVELASAEFTATRSFNMLNLSLNDISRIEVTKVPTPSMPANSIGGNVNMISKSAFERGDAQFRFGVSFAGNSKLLDFEKTPYGAGDRKTYKILPAVDFDYTLPIGRNFGIVITGMHSSKYNPSYSAFSEVWQTSAPGTNASVSNPYFRSLNHRIVIRDQKRRSLSVKADWRVTPQSVLSVTGQWNRLNTRNFIATFAPNVGANGTPTPATGVPMTFGPDFTSGATGRGALSVGGNGDLFEAGTIAGGINYRFDNGTWRVDAGFNYSDADRGRPTKEIKRNFSAFSTTTNVPLRIVFTGVEPNGPRLIQAFNNNNVELDLQDLSLHRPTTANIAAADLFAGARTARANVMRRLNFLPFPVAVQVGASRRVDIRDSRTDTETVTYNGPATLEPYAMQVYTNPDRGFAHQDFRYPSGTRLFRAWEANPGLFSATPAQIRAREAARLTASEYGKETIDAGYAQLESSLFSERLKILAGVRYEKTSDYGEGSLSDPNAVYERNANGTLAHNAAGALIRKASAGAVNSLEELALIQKERASINERSYDSYHPSVHLTYGIRENVLVRFGYARTIGRPNFSSIIPRTVVSEADLDEEELQDPTTIRGTLTVRNTALKPWTADNYDLSVEYYTNQGGVFSAGVFRKEIKDFFGNSIVIGTAEKLAALGFDERYVGWNISTAFNSGDARMTGAEVNARHSLRELGSWGRYFTVFANGTTVKPEGDRAASFNGIFRKTANWGFTFSKGRVTFVSRWSYRGTARGDLAPAFGPDAYEYVNGRTTLDLNIAWQLTKRLAITATMNNVTAEPDMESAYGSETPAYARQALISDFGSAIGIGIRGRF